MMKLAAIAGLAMTLTTLAPAATLPVAVGGAGFECQQSIVPGNCSVLRTFQWGNGDYVGQTVTGTSFGTINQIILALSYEDRLNVGQSQTYDVVINNTTVGSFLINGLDDEVVYFITDTFDFAPIAGPDFTVLFRISSPTTPGGEGSIGWLHGPGNSSFTLSDEGGSAVPEPGTFALLLGPALAGVWAARRRKR